MLRELLADYASERGIETAPTTERGAKAAASRSTK
jgi:RNA polymerase sigma-70 factor (ECF subfamily)